MSAPRRPAPDDPILRGVLTLVRDAFAEMEGRIDPPSSARGLTLEEVAAQARDGEVWGSATRPRRRCS